MFHRNITTKVDSEQTDPIEFELVDGTVNLDELIQLTLNEATHKDGQQHDFDRDHHSIAENKDQLVNAPCSITNGEEMRWRALTYYPGVRRSSRSSVIKPPDWLGYVNAQMNI